MLRATLLAIALLFVPLAASAQHLDVIGNELKEDCSLEKYLSVPGEGSLQGSARTHLLRRRSKRTLEYPSAKITRTNHS